MTTTCGISSICAQKKAEYAHHLVVMPKNEAHGQVRQLQPWTQGVGQYTAKREQKAEIFRSQYQECYTGRTNIEVYPTIEGMMQNYNTKFSKLRMSNVCNLAEVNIYRLPSVNENYSKIAFKIKGFNYLLHTSFSLFN